MVNVVNLSGVKVVVLDHFGPLLATEQAALDAMGEAYGEAYDWLAVPRERLLAEFFILRTGLLGAIVQKFVNYQQKVAFIGDFSEEIARSSAFRDYVYEANKGRFVMFLPSVDALMES